MQVHQSKVSLYSLLLLLFLLFLQHTLSGRILVLADIRAPSSHTTSPRHRALFWRREGGVGMGGILVGWGGVVVVGWWDGVMAPSPSISLSLPL